MRGLYSENDETLMKEIEDDTKKWKDIPCLWIRRRNIINMSILPKAIYTLNAIPIKMPTAFLIELEQTILKFKRTTKDLKNPKQFLVLVSLKNKIKTRRIIIRLQVIL